MDIFLSIDLGTTGLKTAIITELFWKNLNKNLTNQRYSII